MPSGRRGSLERYMPPRRSGGGSGTDQDSPTKSSQGGGEYGAGITDWSAALDLEDELDTLHIGDGNGETDQGDKDKYWSDHELSSWADQVDAMSPKEEKQAPRYNNYSEPPPSNNQQPVQKSYQNNQNYNQQQQKRVNNLPPRFQNMNKENNGGNNSYQSQQFYNSRDSSRENNTRDQDWYQKLGRGRGRGAPLRPPTGQTRPNGGNQTIAQRLLSARHQTRHEDGGEANGYASSNGSTSTTRENNGYAGSRLAGRLNSRHNNHDDSETDGYRSTTTRSIHEDDRLSEASFSDRKSGGGSDLRNRLNKKMKEVDRSHNYGQKFDRSSQGPSMERGMNNHQNNVQHNNYHAVNNGHDDRVEDFVRGIRQSEERSNRQSEDRRFENGHSRNGHGDRNGKFEERDRFYDPRGAGGNKHQNNSRQQLARPKKNTENFNPSYDPPEMRILYAPPGRDKYTREMSSRDVIIVSDLFCDETDFRIYDTLIKELENCGVPDQKLWQLWHGDSHVIADDKRTKWREACPTFNMIIDKIAFYFDMDIKATRLNWYRDTSEWKPFHHDAAAMKPDKARTQNFTVAVSFGVERDAAFEHADSKNVISMPQPNGTIYTFAKDVNIIWRHGILQMPPEKQTQQGRISIIAWGWVPQFDL